MFPASYFPKSYYAGSYWPPTVDDGLPAVAGPYRVVATQIFVAGMQRSEVFLAGASQSETFVAGSQQSEVAR